MKIPSIALTSLLFTSTAVNAFTASSNHVPSAFGIQKTKKKSSKTNLHMKYSVGIVGATGAVGKEIIGCLEKRDFGQQTSKLRIFGSQRSAGKNIATDRFGDIEVELFDVAAARECDVIFLAVSGDFAKEHAAAISEGDDGAVVIDNSSAFRYVDGIPLVVPEINGDICVKGTKLIANPNCTTAIGLMALWPLHQLFGLKRVIMSTYQAASGAGQEGMDELATETLAVLNKERDVADNKIFAHPLPFNVIPHIDAFQENEYTKEEMKVTWETRKICNLPDIPVSCTAVRIPTYRAHSEAITIETEKPVDIEAAREALRNAPGVKLVDDTSNSKYPMPLTATGQDDVEVGRIRKSLVFGDNGLDLFVSGDQLLRGAALNAVLVAEVMDKNDCLV
mmetsp:Transcript_20680/g.30776  ORF Transcript_20680/g.30776 Transcript_20680/m.30776 type:complete len:393 (-) Transcript_20680:141-1319(-)